MENDISIRNTSVTIQQNEVLCRENDLENNLYLIKSGELLVCSRSGTMVTPLAYLKPGDYFGEMSFFDEQPRSADVIATKPTQLIKIHSSGLKDQMPTWLLIIAKEMTNKLRTLDNVIREKGVKRKNTKALQPLSIDEQRKYMDLLKID